MGVSSLAPSAQCAVQSREETQVQGWLRQPLSSSPAIQSVMFACPPRSTKAKKKMFQSFQP